MDAESLGVEVEHNGLLSEAEGLMGLRDDRVDVLIHGLLQVQVWGRDLGYVVTDVRQRNGSLPQLEPRPPGLDTVGSPPVNDLVDR